MEQAYNCSVQSKDDRLSDVTVDICFQTRRRDHVWRLSRPCAYDVQHFDALSVTHHPVSGISFPRNFTCLLIMKTHHSHLISHMLVRHFLHHHCHHPLLLLTSTPGSKPIFFTNPFLHSSSTFPSTGLTPRTPAVFGFSRTCRF